MNSQSPCALTIPTRALVVLCGPSGVGKSTWARRHFQPTQVIASDECRRLVSDDTNWHEPAVSEGAFSLLYHLTEQRLRLSRLAVVDSTAMMAGTRRHLIRLARRWDAPTVLVRFTADIETCVARDTARAASVGARIIRGQIRTLDQVTHLFTREGWDAVHTLDPQEQETLPVLLEPLAHERPDDGGPFDIVGDVHGCLTELQTLLGELGWEPDGDGVPHHPDGRRLIFVGDLACGGPDGLRCWDLALSLRERDRADTLFGDHDLRVLRLLDGMNRALDRGLEVVARERERLPGEVLDRVHRGLTTLHREGPPHLLLDRGRLAVTHAALRDSHLGKRSRGVVQICRHGERDWERDHQTQTLIVHGHRPTEEPRQVNNTLNLDTGCVLGGSLTALRWPERTLVSTPAECTHWSPESQGSTSPDSEAALSA